MRTIKDEFIDHIVKLIFRNLPNSKLINFNDEINIKDTKYRLNEILSYTYYHPIDIISFRPNNSNNNSIIRQFYNNLYMFYSYSETDYTHDNHICMKNKNILDNIPELSFFAPETSDFIKYRLSNYESSSVIRGCKIYYDSIIVNNKYILGINDPISPIISQLMENYIMLCNNEDKFDFYVPYYPFIKFFINKRYSPLFVDIAMKRFREQDVNQIMGNYIANNISDIFKHVHENNSRSELNNIYDKIYQVILLYDILDYDEDNFINLILFSDFRYIHSLSKDYIRKDNDFRRLLSLKGMYNYYKYPDVNIKDWVLSYLSIMLFLTNNISKSSTVYARNYDNISKFILDIIANISNTYNDEKIIEELSRLDSMDIDMADIITKRIYDFVNGNRLGLHKLDYTLNIFNTSSYDSFIQSMMPELKRNITTELSMSNGDQTDINRIRNTLEKYKKRGYIVNNEAYNNILSSLDEIEGTESINTQLTDLINEMTNNDNLNIIIVDAIVKSLLLALKNNYIESNDWVKNHISINIRLYSAYRLETTNYIKIDYNEIDVREYINSKLSDINKEYNVYDNNTKINYKSFISLLPSFYYLIYHKYFQSVVSTPTRKYVTIGTQTDSDTINKFVNTSSQTDVIPPILKSNINRLSSIDLFWDGIPYNDFDRMPLYTQEVIKDCCLVLAIVNNNKECMLYRDAIEKNIEIDSISILPYPYSGSQTLFNIFEAISNKFKADLTKNIVPSTSRYIMTNNIGLTAEGNKEFISELYKCTNMADLINLYIKIYTFKSGNSDLKLPPKQNLYFILTLLNLLGYAPKLTKRNMRDMYGYIITPNRSINTSTFLDLLNRQYNISYKNKEVSNTIITLMIPILNYLRTKTSINKENIYDIKAGTSNDNFTIIIKKDPIDILNKMDLSFLKSESMHEIMNKDLLDIDNYTLKNILLYNEEIPDKIDIVELICNNIPDSLYIKADIKDQVYNKLTAGAASINEILNTIVETEYANLDMYDDESDSAREFMKKLIKLLKKTSNQNLEDNANIIKSHISASINNVFERYSCPERLPNQYLANVRLLLKQCENDGINVSEDVKIDLKDTIHTIYTKTYKLVKLLAVFGAAIDIVKAFKRLNKNTDSTEIDPEFIANICRICKDNFNAYTRNIESIYKNTMKTVFKDTDNLEFETEC
jgi:hypothetical protein